MNIRWNLIRNTMPAKINTTCITQFFMNLLRGSVCVSACVSACGATCAESYWMRHVVHEGEQSMTAVAGDFTGDGLVDVISDSGRLTRLFVSPDWREVILDEHDDCKWYIHSEFFDVDRDGDLDYIAARYNPGRIIWLEQPEKSETQRW